ncbi:MAG: CxxxxCH/CxxCH domain-containing protein, partial [Myxococcales bacterium]|nr:CxxxxCH/CxxCH domain-containing protein [Myxococcales bacterium]
MGVVGSRGSLAQVLIVIALLLVAACTRDTGNKAGGARDLIVGDDTATPSDTEPDDGVAADSFLDWAAADLEGDLGAIDDLAGPDDANDGGPTPDMGAPCVEFQTQVHTPIVNAICVGCHDFSPAGFTLSGDVDADYAEILKRINLQDPASSLVLVKGNGGLSHGGGDKLSDEDYATFLLWIQGGAPRTCGTSTEDAQTPDASSTDTEADGIDTSTTDTGTPTCGSCHAIPPDIGAHKTHTDPSTYNFPCTTCHPFPELHMNGEKDVDFSSSDPANLSGVYTAQTQSCSSLYCHSNGRSPASQSGSFNWNGSALTCGSCHSLTNLSGKHTFHKNKGLVCGDCHSGVSGSDTIIDFSIHVDGVIDY